MLLIASGAHPQDDKQRNRSGFAVEPNANHCTVEDLTIGSSASERVFQASQSVFTLRQVRLTVSLLTAPPYRAVNARRTRRVLVPAR